MVGHQLVLVEDPFVAADGLGEKVEELQAIAVAEEDVLAVVAAVVQVPGGAREVEPKRSRSRRMGVMSSIRGCMR